MERLLKGCRHCFLSMLALVFGEARLPGCTSSGFLFIFIFLFRWNLPSALPGHQLSGRALDRHQQEWEQAELADEWELGVHCSGGGRQRASDYRG